PERAGFRLARPAAHRVPEGQVTIAVRLDDRLQVQRVRYRQLIERAPQPPQTTVVELEEIGSLETYRRLRCAERAKLAMPRGFDRPESSRCVHILDRASDGDPKRPDNVEQALHVVDQAWPERSTLVSGSTYVPPDAREAATATAS